MFIANRLHAYGEKKTILLPPPPNLKQNIIFKNLHTVVSYMSKIVSTAQLRTRIIRISIHYNETILLQPCHNYVWIISIALLLSTITGEDRHS